MKKSILLLSLFMALSFEAICIRASHLAPTNCVNLPTFLGNELTNLIFEPRRELKDGLLKLTNEEGIKSGLHLIFTSSNGVKYCVKLKNGKVLKLFVTATDGVQLKPVFNKSKTGSSESCSVCVVVTKKPKVEECWEWICD